MYIARQPIFNTKMEVYGYELLYRFSESSKMFDGSSPIQATATIINGLFESGLENLIDGKRAFVNFDSDFLHLDLTELIEPEKLVIEMLEDVQVDIDMMVRLQELKDKGYMLALDDFVESYNHYPLVPMADIIKYDLIGTPMAMIKSDVARALKDNKILLAEKVENISEFEEAKAMGFTLFQGFFFSKPSIIGSSNDKTTTKAQYGRMINELMKDEPSYQILAEIIEKDVHLAYRLMRVVKSRSGDDILYSIKRALTYMGLKEIQRWINILMLRDLSDKKPDELMRMSLIRTKFAERITMHTHLSKMKYEASMLGLFSTIDAMLDQSMDDALKGISLPASIIDALVHGKGDLYPIFQLVCTYEKADWKKAQIIISQLGLNEDEVVDDYKSALIWTKEVMDMIYKVN
jgi:EAL and modified HD-GYP domain-containing signal transduction protein